MEQLDLALAPTPPSEVSRSAVVARVLYGCGCVAAALAVVACARSVMRAERWQTVSPVDPRGKDRPGSAVADAGARQIDRRGGKQQQTENAEQRVALQPDTCVNRAAQHGNPERPVEHFRRHARSAYELPQFHKPAVMTSRASQEVNGDTTPHRGALCKSDAVEPLFKLLDNQRDQVASLEGSSICSK